MREKKMERSLNRDEKRYMLALTTIAGLGSYRIQALIDSFHSAEHVFKSSVKALCAVSGISKPLAYKITRFGGWKKVEGILADTRRVGAHLIACTEPDYPERLSRICDPPPVLWVKGNTDLLKQHSIAIVGTRRPDRYGREQSTYWGREMAATGLAVVSGLAYGIDRLVHQAAVSEKGRTVAVLPGGINRIAPAGNRDLAMHILEEDGLLITECPPDSKAFAASFPKRNRIISGMSLGTIVIQSGIEGGSMITARTAIDYGREVFVVPHSLDRPSGRGNLHLIRAGNGKLIESPEDVLVELKTGADPDTIERARLPGYKVNGLTFDEQQIGKLLSDSALPFDNLMYRSGIRPGDLLPLLLKMEMKGLVRQRPGRLFEWAAGPIE